MLDRLYKSFLSHKEILWALVILLVVNIALFHAVYLDKLYPYPGDLLVTFFFPWSGGGFSGFNQWTTNKEWNGADAIRQMLPWKEQIVASLRSGSLPLWNPFNFSGSPLLANMQSGVFFPGTILLMLLPLLQGWTLQVVATPIILGFGAYLFFRSEKFSFLAAILGGVIFSNISYITIWQEVQVVMQSAIVLPFILFLINKKKTAVIPILLAISVFGGHIQTALYIYSITLIFLLYRKNSVVKSTLILVTGLLISGVQLIPSVELYLNSAREGEASKRLFPSFILPWKHLVTVLVPDFFGNPATRNFWSDHYGERQAYVGVATVVLAAIGGISSYRDKFVKIIIAIGIAGIIFSTAPGAYLFPLIRFPILSTSMPARTIFLFQFSMACLAVVGASYLFGQDKKLKKVIISILLVAGLYFVALLSTQFLSPDKQAIALKNSVIPICVFGLTSAAALIYQKIKTSRLQITKFILAGTLLLLATFEYSYWFNKYHPFSPAKFFFPSHPILEAVKNKAGIDRFHGNSAAHLDKNFATFYGIYSAEGYDPLYIKRYGEFIASAKDGHLPKQMQRSDADLNTEELPVSQSFTKDRVMNLLGIKYQTEKNENPSSDWDPNFDKFHEDRFNLIWQKDKWKIYERRSALSRFIFFDSYVVKPNPDEIIKTFYDKDFPYDHTAILENKPAIEPQSGGTSNYHVNLYKPLAIRLTVNLDRPKLLFLSDAYYPGWRASVDGVDTPILRADYAFRAISIPSGSHEVKFYYDPISLKIGFGLTLFGLLVSFFILRSRAKN